ncbi:sensor histidine kinase [Bacterioplanoides sp.]|uniref:sensor histidine kinase n=1 Tax=Bacterioplanoides sp. TaxID=2066072 RepID=UPI003B00DCE4
MMKQTTEEKFKFHIYYPWKTLLFAGLLLFYVLVYLSPFLQTALKIPVEVLNILYLKVSIFLFFIMALWEVRQFRQQKKTLKQRVQRLWNNKKELQLKAQTSASHTDKLKLFISDKLLEYIEYDEKFLHFKSIASEVRHNGVISFDKVQSALLNAKEQSPMAKECAAQESTSYDDALQAMRYLWDLLDLSTTDNMALHIGNQVTRCEEQVFEAELQGMALTDLPVSPYFDPAQAIQDSLTQHLGIVLSDHNPQLLLDENGAFRVELQPCEPLLGNANHFILMLENLLRNAQFFAAKRAYKSPFSGVSVSLTEQQQYLDLRIYNRGPEIPADQFDQIFQLGYSTRRIKEHHGKGLGLYFVQQIVQGFDGAITIKNIKNAAAFYHLRLEFVDGTLHNLSLKQTIEDGVPLVVDESASEGGPALMTSNTAAAKQWQTLLDNKLVSIEVHQQGSDRVSRLAVDHNSKHWFDPQHPDKPRWQLTLAGRKQEKLSFIALDIRGVEFQIRMPTLSGRVDGIPALDNGPDVDKLGQHFQSPDDF